MLASVFTILLFICLTHSQTPSATPNSAVPHSSVKAMWSEGNALSNDALYGVVKDSLGNFVYIGIYTSNGSLSFIPSSSYNGGTDCFLVKYSSAGVVLWAVPFGGFSTDTVRGIAIDASDNLYITGSTSSPTVFWNLNNATSPSSIKPTSGIDFMVAKYDSSGNFQWGYVNGSNGQDTGMSVAAAEDGSVFVCGYMKGAWNMPPNITGYGGLDWVIMKLNANGNLIKVVSYGGSSDDAAYALTLDQTGALYVTGYFMSNNMVVNGTTLPAPLSGGYDDILLLKLATTDLSLIWHLVIDCTYGGRGFGIKVDSANNVLLAGRCHENAIIGNVTIGTGTGGGYNGVIVKLTPSAAVLWGKIFVGTWNVLTHDVAIGVQDAVHLSGVYLGVLSVGGPSFPASNTNLGIWQAKFSGTGQYLWSQGYSNLGSGNTDDPIFKSAVNPANNDIATFIKVQGTATIEGQTFSSTSSDNVFVIYNDWIPSPSPTPSVTPSPSRTPSPTSSITPTASRTPSNTPSTSSSPSVTPSTSPTPSQTPSQSPSPSVTPSSSATPTPSRTPSPTSSVTPTCTVTPTTSVTPTASTTPSTSPSATPSATASTTATPSPSVTPSLSPSSSRTPGFHFTLITMTIDGSQSTFNETDFLVAISEVVDIPLENLEIMNTKSITTIFRIYDSNGVNSVEKAQELEQIALKEQSLLTEDYGIYTQTFSADYSQAANPPSSSQSKGSDSTIAVAVAVPVGVSAVVAGVVGFVVMRKRQNRSVEDLPEDEEMQQHNETEMLPSVELQAQPDKPEISKKKKKNKWEIHYNSLVVDKELGRGAFGVVYLAKWRNTTCVVKQLDKAGANAESFMKEANNVKHLRPHPNICQVFGVCANLQYPLCIVMEYVPYGSLWGMLLDKKLDMDLDFVIDFARDIASGMSHLHSENIVHCDLACRNLLVAPKEGQKYLIKITDFGLSRVTEEDIYNADKDALFPVRWTAPETIRARIVSKPMDVWSYGVTLWEMIEGKQPYPELSNTQVVSAVCDKGHRLPKPEKVNIPESLYNLMKQCWLEDPKQRPSFDDICAQLTIIEREVRGVNSWTQYTDQEEEKTTETTQQGRGISEKPIELGANYGNIQVPPHQENAQYHSAVYGNNAPSANAHIYNTAV